MTHDSHKTGCGPSGDSPLSHANESFGDTLLWAAGMSKAAAEQVDERMDTLERQVQKLNARLNKQKLSADERANINAALKLVHTAQSEIDGQAQALTRLAHIHSDQAKSLSGQNNQGATAGLTPPPLIPGEAPQGIFNKSLILAAMTRAALKNNEPGDKIAHIPVKPAPGTIRR